VNTALAVMLTMIGAPPPPAVGQVVVLQLLYTGDSYGFLGREGVAGGLARRKAALDRARAEGAPSLLVDAGNALGPFYYARYDRGQTAAALLAELDYDAINVGAHDLGYGAARIDTLVRAHELPAVSSNLLRGASPWGAQVRVLERGGVRVAVLGLLPTEDLPASERGGPALSANAPLAALRAQLARVRAQADLVVLLSGLDRERTAQLLRAAPGVDLAITRSAGAGPDPFAHDQGRTPHEQL
jgi:5'-nucleotidase